MVGALLLTQGQAYDHSRYLLNLLLDNEFGLYENLAPNTLMLAPHAMKASATVDPDTPRLHEAMRGDHRDDFLTAMGEEIAALEAHGTWNVVRRDTMPAGSNLLPGTWALKIKRYPMAACGSTRPATVSEVTSRLQELTISRAMLLWPPGLPSVS